MSFYENLYHDTLNPNKPRLFKKGIEKKTKENKNIQHSTPAKLRPPFMSRTAALLQSKKRQTNLVPAKRPVGVLLSYPVVIR
jgi:hypothetical protein